MRLFTYFKYFAIVLFFTQCKKNTREVVVDTPPSETVLVLNTLLSDQGIIWGFDWLPNGQLIFTQKTGTMRLYNPVDSSVTNVSGMPANIFAAGQGGLMDICVAPDFATTNRIYTTYSITGGFLQLASFELNGNTASNWQMLAVTESPSTWNGHYGSRIVIGNDGYVYWAVGEGGGGSLGGASSPHQNGQRLNTLWGKIHRLNRDGSIPADNPVLPGAAEATTQFSMGHRNPQGLAFNPTTNVLYSSEHGPNGGCELNVIEAGRNYGWPLYSTGINYNGTIISNGHAAAGITEPILHWSPAFAPSNITFINHPSFGRFNGNLLIGSLARRQILMYEMGTGTPTNPTVLFENIGRVRNVKQVPGASIYFSVEDGGRLMEIKAK